ncbi:MAG: hypothetical protein FWG34_10820 [Oscillospiraceae bacterium]|nr:hypothetical protein [Oscillospiraceae bacterium]
MNISEKIAYLKGLAEGLGIGADPKNGRIICGILDVLEEMACLDRGAKGAKSKKKEPQIWDGEENEADSEYIDGVFELTCPHCKKQIFIQTEDILESETMSIECPECGEAIDIIDEAEEMKRISCENCPGCIGHSKDGDEEDLAF